MRHDGGREQHIPDRSQGQAGLRRRRGRRVPGRGPEGLRRRDRPRHRLRPHPTHGLRVDQERVLDGTRRRRARTSRGRLRQSGARTGRLVGRRVDLVLDRALRGGRHRGPSRATAGPPLRQGGHPHDRLPPARRRPPHPAAARLLHRRPPPQHRRRPGFGLPGEARRLPREPGRPGARHGGRRHARRSLTVTAGRLLFLPCHRHADGSSLALGRPIGYPGRTHGQARSESDPRSLSTRAPGRGRTTLDPSARPRAGLAERRPTPCSRLPRVHRSRPRCRTGRSSNRIPSTRGNSPRRFLCVVRLRVGLARQPLGRCRGRDDRSGRCVGADGPRSDPHGRRCRRDRRRPGRLRRDRVRAAAAPARRGGRDRGARGPVGCDVRLCQEVVVCSRGGYP
ncbi:putative Uncharacterized 50.6 kDa protein in the 5'region of gyrA and gyrB [Frigoribacterium sp. 9N]|nr:putative Uncharacterized 50.6 kDa protein in the 5'region of gyrA and gyrB [Frigoribacterium sp. 9N]